MTETVTQPVEKMGIRQAAVYADVSEQYVRSYLIRKGKVEFVKNDKGIWETTKDKVDAYLATVKERHATTQAKGEAKASVMRAAPGKTAVIHYGFEVATQVEEFLASLNIVPGPRYNAEAMKKSQEKQKAKKAAERAAKLAAAAAAPEPTPAPEG